MAQTVQVIVTGDSRDAQRALNSLGSNFSSLQSSAGRTEQSFSGVSSKMREVSGGANESSGSISRLGAAFGGAGSNSSFFSRTISLIKWPAIIQGAGVAGGAVAAFGTAAAGLVGALAPLSGLLAVRATAMIAFGQAAGTVMLATSGLSEAFKASAEGGAAFAEAMAKLTPAARAFVKEVLTMQPAFEGLKRIAASNLFGPLEGELGRLRVLFPAIRQAVADTATVLGELAREGIRMVTSGPWARDFQTVAQSNVTIIENIGKAGLALADAFRHVIVAAQPLTRWLSEMALAGAEAVRQFIAGARASGDLAAFFRDTQSVASTLGNILKNLGTVLVNIFSAARPLGDWLLANLERITAEWAKLTSTRAGQNAIRDFAMDAKPVLEELGKLIGDIAKLFGELATSGGVADLIHQFRTELLPTIGEIATSASGRLLPAIMDVADAFLELFAAFGTETGVLVSFVGTLGTIADAFNALPDPIKDTFVQVAAVAGILKALSFTAAITGASTLAGAMRALAGSSAAAAISTSTFGTAIGVGWLGLVGKVSAAVAGLTAPIALVVAGFVAMGGASVVLTNALSGRLGPVVSGLSGLFGGVLSPMGLVVAMVGTLVRAVVSAAGQIGPTFQRMGGLIVAAMGIIGRAISTGWSTAQRLFTTAMTTIGRAVSTGWSAITRTVSTAMSAIGRALSTAWSAITRTVSTAMAAVGRAVGTGWAAIQRAVSTALGAIQRAVSTAWAAIQRAISTAMGAVQRTISAAWSAIQRAVSAALSAIQRAVSSAWSAIQRAVSAAMGAIQRVISSAWSAVTRAISAAMSAAQRAVSSAWSAIQRAFSSGVSNAIREVQSLVSRIPQALGSLASAMGRAGSAAMQALWNGLRSVAGGILSWVQGFVSDMVGRLTNIPGMSPIDHAFWKVGQWAMGGLEQGLKDRSGGPLNVARSVANEITHVLQAAWTSMEQARPRAVAGGVQFRTDRPGAGVPQHGLGMAYRGWNNRIGRAGQRGGGGGGGMFRTDRPGAGVPQHGLGMAWRGWNNVIGRQARRGSMSSAARTWGQPMGDHQKRRLGGSGGRNVNVQRGAVQVSFSGNPDRTQVQAGVTDAFHQLVRDMRQR